MSTKTATTIDQHVRITSNTGKFYLILKDGKKHTIVSLRATAKKFGVGLYGPIFRLRRVLERNFNKTIAIVDRHEKTGTLQIVPFVKSKKAAPAKSKAAKKPVAKKPAAKKTAKPVSKPQYVSQAKLEEVGA